MFPMMRWSELPQLPPSEQLRLPIALTFMIADGRSRVISARAAPHAASLPASYHDLRCAIAIAPAQSMHAIRKPMAM
jgi:hypothetical protein